jgi:hypothetical protein
MPLHFLFMDQLLESKHEPLDAPLPNNVWRLVHGFLYAALLFLIPSLICFLISRHVARPGQGTTGWLLASLICLPLGLAMLMTAAITSFSAWRAGQALANLTKGNYLVSWTYSPEDWSAYCEEQVKTLRGIGWALAIIFGAVAILLGGISFCLPPGKRSAPGLMALGALAMAALAIWTFVLIGRAKRTRVANRPRVIIGRDAMYCGGDVLLWRAAGNGLYRAHVNPADTPTGTSWLEVVIGISRGSKKVAQAADLAMLAVGRPSFVSSYQISRRIPVPRGEEETARQICRIILAGDSPPHPAPAKPPSPITHTPSPTPAHAPLPPLPSTIFHSTPTVAEPPKNQGRNWWKITLWFLGSGAAMFIITVADSARTGGKPTTVGTSCGVIGLILALLSLIPLTIAITATIRRAMR